MEDLADVNMDDVDGERDIDEEDNTKQHDRNMNSMPFMDFSMTIGELIKDVEDQ